MEEQFLRIYKQLNQQQQIAVDTLDGPVLVIAGPGTGKTQLLSARVANILLKTDTPPQNVLCLTFTENGAANMRDRLAQFIGQAAYDVNIGTYHAFGGDLIRRYPQYFAETRLQTPLDELGKRQIIGTIVDAMGYHNPLKQTQHHLGDLISTISEIKRALLSSTALRAIAVENEKFISASQQPVAELFAGFKTMPRSLAKALPYFEGLQTIFKTISPADSASQRFGSLAARALEQLADAIASAEQTAKTTPLTAWKNKWLAKNGANQFCVAGQLENQRIHALAAVLDEYQTRLAAHGFYDFDDMILRAIEALEQNDELKYSLQEQYLYILLDEFQDTNAAQSKLVQLLSDNPVHEGRPNIMAVGDDDQAIYAFQGAQYSNMLDFYKSYRDVAIINLTQNYRSQAAILTTAENIANQIDSRLTQYFAGMTKQLQAASTPAATALQRIEFRSPIAEYAGIADLIEHLINSGTQAQQIAVLAPKHRQLRPLVAYLNAKNIAVSYEKRENILQSKIIVQLLVMCRLVMAIAEDRDSQANALWPQVLSYEFWQLPTADIWRMSWQLQADKNHSWSAALLDNPQFHKISLLFLAVASRVATEPCETILDYLVGNETLATNEPDSSTVSSPLRDYYTNNQLQTDQPEIFYDTVSHLTVLRTKFRNYQANQDKVLLLPDFLDFISLYETADQPMLNTSPYHQQANAVQLMTVFKAKGLEFEHVILPSCSDSTWGKAARSNSNKLTLPANLEPIRHAGTSHDEQLRILYVAVTRARIGLYLTNSLSGYDAKLVPRLQYFNEQETEDGQLVCHVLPPEYKLVQKQDAEPPAQAVLELDWRGRHTNSLQLSGLQDLLSEQLAHYQLSPTHLTTFIDTQYGGPESFFLHSLLHFQRAPLPDSEYGNAVHETLEWLQQQLNQTHNLPGIVESISYFTERMNSKKLTDLQLRIYIERGQRALQNYLSNRQKSFMVGSVAEKNFRAENVFVDTAHMAGKIDRLDIDQTNKTIAVIDYKTGASHSRWTSDARLHRYKLQLYCYKFLVENSRSYKGYRVTLGRLEFIEPDATGNINSLDLYFTKDEQDQARALIKALWQHVHTLQFPSIVNYSASLAGMRQFESDLINGII